MSLFFYMQIEKTQTETHSIQNLKHLLTQILLTNTTYDCMPINSLINSIDKSISLFDAVNILLSEQADQLMVWDEQNMQWIWMLTLVDTTRLILHALKTYSRTGKVDFQSFEHREQQYVSLPVCNQQQILKVMRYLRQKSIADILKELKGKAQDKKKYVRMIYAKRQYKLSFVILTMVLQKIHRIIVQDTQDPKIIISVLNFKDILLYLLRIANQSNFNFYSTIEIKSLLANTKLKECEITSDKCLWQAFEMMTDKQRSLWIVVTDAKTKKFLGMLYREDFRDTLMKWRLDYLWMTTGEFLKLKKQTHTGLIPQYRYFNQTDTTKDIIWKIVMTKRNSIVCIDENMHVKYSIGLMQLFKLYVQ